MRLPLLATIGHPANQLGVLNQFSYLAPLQSLPKTMRLSEKATKVIVFAARQAGGLQKKQLRIAQQCEILTRGLARPGIVGLVDEATGYQHIRARNALETILNRHFPDGFQDKPDCSVRRLDATGFWRGIG